MYLNKVKIRDYRNFHDTTFDFDEGLNVIVGANNSGKSNVVNVIGFLATDPSKGSNIDDINKNMLKKNFAEYKTIAPQIAITYFIRHFLDYNKPDSALARLQDFLIYNSDGEFNANDTDTFEINAEIELRYQLDSAYENDYKVRMAGITDFNTFMIALSEFNDRFRWTYYNNSYQSGDSMKSALQLFDIECIDAVRQTEKIKPHSQQYISEKIKETGSDAELKNEIDTKIKDKFGFIVSKINEDLNSDQDMIGITNGKNKFISSFEFDGGFAQFFKYGLQDEIDGYALPLHYNGLGYNNLIQINNMIKQKKDNDYNILLIEEPESHLHPNMQYKLLKYISGLREIVEKRIKNQIIITTHSSNISASTKIENIILMNYERPVDAIGNVTAIRIDKNFKLDKNLTSLCIDKSVSESDEDYDNFLLNVTKTLEHSKKHMEKFLDITRSDILFSAKVVLVEGLAEKLLLPKFAEMLGMNLIDKHIVTVEVGGINFNSFLPLFLGQEKRVLCLSDCDFRYFEKCVITEDGKEKKKDGLSDFSLYSNIIKQKQEHFFKREFKNLQQFKIFTQQKLGSTFETELLLENYDSTANFNYLMKLVLPDSLNEFSDKREIVYWNDNLENINANTQKVVKPLLDLFYNKFVTETDTEKKKVIERIFFACVFYAYSKDQKGDMALAIASDTNVVGILSVPMKAGEIALKVPEYIKEGLQWLLQ